MNDNHTKNSYLFFSLSNEERESAIHFFLEAILKARDHVPGLSRGQCFDEDVNVYLALLFAVSLPEYHEMADPFLSPEPKDVLFWARQAQDPMLCYFIYKVNADHLLVQSTILGDEAQRARQIYLQKGANEERKMATVYYDHASKCHRNIYHKKTGVGEVLEKISRHFDFYQQVLVAVKPEYFKFVNCFRDQIFQQFLAQVNQYEKQSLHPVKMDRFLEIYHEWMMTRNPDLKPKILQLARELKDVDPKFIFDAEKAFHETLPNTESSVQESSGL